MDEIEDVSTIACFIFNSVGISNLNSHSATVILLLTVRE